MPESNMSEMAGVASMLNTKVVGAAGVLGDRAVGKTTFLGLLFHAQVRYGTRNEDTFRFRTDPATLETMGEIYRGMAEGSFPASTLKDQLNEPSFVLGYRLQRYGVLPESVTRGRHVVPFASIPATVFDVAGEDISEYIDSGVASTPVVQKLLSCDAAVLLVDCSKMTGGNSGPKFDAMLRYDKRVARLIVNFSEYKAQEWARLQAQGRVRGRPLVFISVFLTQWDQLDEEALARLGLHGTVPPGATSYRRRKYVEKLLRVFMPVTLSQLNGAKLVGVNLDQTAYFISYVETVKGPDGMAPAGRPRIRVRSAGVDEAAGPVYPYEEYVDFLEYFRRVAKEMASARKMQPFQAGGKGPKGGQP